MFPWGTSRHAVIGQKISILHDEVPFVVGKPPMLGQKDKSQWSTSRDISVCSAKHRKQKMSQGPICLRIYESVHLASTALVVGRTPCPKAFTGLSVFKNVAKSPWAWNFPTSISCTARVWYHFDLTNWTTTAAKREPSQRVQSICCACRANYRRQDGKLHCTLIPKGFLVKIIMTSRTSLASFFESAQTLGQVLCSKPWSVKKLGRDVEFSRD